MKRTFFLTSFVLIFAALAGAAFAAEAQGADTPYKLDNGVPVYIKPNTTNSIDALQILISGGVFGYTKEYSGIEQAALTMATKGSEKYPYQAVRQFCYENSTSFSAGAGDLSSSLTLVSINENLLDSLEVLTSCFMHPAFPKDEYTNLMTDYQQNIQAKLNNPLSLLTWRTSQKITEGHVFSTNLSANEDSIGNLSLEAIKSYYPSLLDSRRIAVVAYTSCDAQTLLAALNKGIGTIPALKTELPKGEVPPLKPSGEPLVVTHPSAANSGIVIRSIAAASCTSEDYIAECLAEAIYNKIMFNVIRTKHGVCYTPQCGNDGTTANVAYEILYSCTDYENCKAAMQEARDIMAAGRFIDSVKSNGKYTYSTIEKQLPSFKNAMINSLYSSQKTSLGLLSRMSNALTLFGDINAYDHLAEQIRAVTANDVQRVFEKYYLADEELWAFCVGPGEEGKIKL